MDDQVVRSQIAAHYPQARIRQVPVDDDPIFVHVGEQAWGLTLRSGGPEYVPLRTFRDDDLLDPGSDPLLAVIGSLSALRPGERVLSPACCCAPWAPTGPRPTSRRPSRTRASSGPTRPTPTRPSPSNWTASPWPCWAWGRPGRPQGLPVGAGRRVSQGVAPGFGFSALRPHRRGLGLVALEAGPQPGLRPVADQGEGLPHRLRRRAPGRRRAARASGGRTAGQGACWSRWPPPTATTTTPLGPGSG